MKYFDLQVNGAFGMNFTDPELTEEACLAGIEKILATGCDRFLPTFPTAPMEVYRRNLPLVNRVIERHGLRWALPGFHLEGPFISREPGYVGAHHPPAVREPSIPLFDELYALADGKVALLTLAIELIGAQELIEYAHGLGIVVSAGHSNCTAEQLDAYGVDTMTHLGNGLPNALDRHRNPIWAGLAKDDMTIMAITDGHHLPPRVLKCYLRCKGLDRFIAVSDACSVAGLPPGRYHSYGNDAVLEPNGLYHNPAKGCLVGSSSLLKGCAEVLRNELGLDDEAIERVCWTNPHRLLEKRAAGK